LGFSFVFRSRRTSPAPFVKYEVLRTDCDWLGLIVGGASSHAALQAGRNAIWTVVSWVNPPGPPSWVNPPVGPRFRFPMPEALPYCWDLGLRHLLPCGGKSIKAKA
jgi:hypothetical protein